MNKRRNTLLILVFAALLGSCMPETEDTSQDRQTIDPHYLDPYRPQIHYSRHTDWLSDPNGLFYFDGQWHLMFQGFSNRLPWRGTNWDHAVSTDLLHWEHRPTVLQAEGVINYYSGSAVVDTCNISGLGSGEQIPILLFYTTDYDRSPVRHFNKISIAYSVDNAQSWVYGDLDAVEHTGHAAERDPSVFWHEPGQKWIMATVGDHAIRFYSSENLLDWTYESEALHGSSWECPDLNTMTVEETGETKVVLITSKHGAPNSSHGTAYHVGIFDGHQFHPEDSTETLQWLDWGTDFYAGITYSNAPEERVLLQSWFGWPSQINRSFARTSKFAGTMNLIRELSLHRDSQGTLYLRSMPIDEYKKLRMDSLSFEEFALTGRKTIRNNIGSHEPVEILLETTLQQGATFGIRLKNDFGEDYLFHYDDWHNQFIADRSRAGTLPRHINRNYNDLSRMPYSLEEQRLKLRIYWDVSTFEVFVDEGRQAFSQLLYPREPFDQIELFAHGGHVSVDALRIYDLKSIWTLD